MNLSIVVPYYQKGEAFRETWLELKNQLAPGDEVIVVDDHSLDKFPFCDCKLLRVISPPKVTPHIYRLNTLRNFGIQHARNDAIIVLDPDCIPNPGFVESAKKIHDAAVLFAGLIDFVEEDGEISLDPRGERRNSRWVDLLDISAGMVWGGCMMFSKSRTKLVGWFDTEYDGEWGAEDHDFGTRCFHSGMRIRYEPRLSVVHQYHSKIPAKIRQEGYKRNLNLWIRKRAAYAKSFNVVTPYNPAVSVNIVTMMRPYYLDQCIRSIFRTRMPLKLYIVNQGDSSKEQMDEINWWKTRWAVNYEYNEKAEPLPQVRNKILLDAKRSNMKYHITLDDDAIVLRGGIETLVRVAEENPDYDAISGYIFELPSKERMLGGYIGSKSRVHYDLPRIKRDITEVQYLSTGFTLIRLSSLTLFDEAYEYGWDDWDWSLTMRQNGLKLGVCGNAGVTHRVLFTPTGLKRREDPPEYKAVRYDRERASRMDALFMDKWGYLPVTPKLWTGKILGELS